MVTTTAKAVRRGWGRRKQRASLATWAVATAALMPMQHVHAADWKVTPIISLKETYTDNVALAAPGAERTEAITEVSPGLTIKGTGARLKVNARYELQNVLYASQQDKNTTHHQLNADAKAELIDGFFFLDGKAAINQQNISLFGSQSSDNIHVTNNRTTVETYSLSPYLRQRFGSTASSELRYTHDGVDANTAGFSNSQSDNILLRLNSGTAFKTMAWGLQYNDKKTHYTNGNTLDMETATGNLRYLMTPQFSLTATGGYEKNGYISTAEQPQGYFWTTGFSWAPTQRTKLEASAGKRYYGNTYSLAANHRSRNTVWNVNYDESVTTTQSQFQNSGNVNTLDIVNAIYAYEIDPQKRKILVDNHIAVFGLPATLPNHVNSLSNRVFLQKQLKASAAFNSAKSTLILSAFHALRDAQTALSFDSSLFGVSSFVLTDKTKQLGAHASWNWRITPRTNINTAAGYTRSSSPTTGRIDHNKSVTLGMSRQFQPKLKGNIELRQQQLDTTQSGADYREHAVTASLTLSF